MQQPRTRSEQIRAALSSRCHVAVMAAAGVIHSCDAFGREVAVKIRPGDAREAIRYSCQTTLPAPS
jgi:hypothetical protein